MRSALSGANKFARALTAAFPYRRFPASAHSSRRSLPAAHVFPLARSCPRAPFRPVNSRRSSIYTVASPPPVAALLRPVRCCCWSWLNGIYAVAFPTWVWWILLDVLLWLSVEGRWILMRIFAASACLFFHTSKKLVTLLFECFQSLYDFMDDLRTQ